MAIGGTVQEALRRGFKIWITVDWLMKTTILRLLKNFLTTHQLDVD
jgi:hypothetical protein